MVHSSLRVIRYSLQELDYLFLVILQCLFELKVLLGLLISSSSVEFSIDSRSGRCCWVRTGGGTFSSLPFSSPLYFRLENIRKLTGLSLSARLNFRSVSKDDSGSLNSPKFFRFSSIMEFFLITLSSKALSIL